MNIIICGAGRVGYTIAKLLSEQDHSITVIDQSSEDIQKINEDLDVKSIVGKATFPTVLEKANAEEADMIIAVTRSDEINMLICQIAFSVFKISKKIARIRSQEYLDTTFSKVYSIENLPIDVIISPEVEIAKSIQRKLEAPGALDNVPFADNKIRLLEIDVDDSCPLVDIKLEDITKKFSKLEANILGVIRNEKFIFLKKKDVMKKHDKAYVIINSSQMQLTLDAFGHDEKISNKFLIIGGGNIGFNLAKNLENSMDAARIKIVEKNKDDSSLLISANKKIKLIKGEEKNHKITTLKDTIEKKVFYGIGFDVHRLVPGRKMYLGGIKIKSKLGTLGHSDGDPILHAITDAILGACGMGDIGEKFSDKSRKYKDIRSTILLNKVIKDIKSKNFDVNNIDINVITQTPKLKKLKKKIILSISKLCRINKNKINLKGKTAEKLGVIGKEKAIACEVIASIKKNYG